MEIGFPIIEDDVKQKGLKGNYAFRVVDNYFQLEFRMGPIWDLIEQIFNMWDNIGIKIQKVKKIKAVAWSSGQGGLGVKNFPKDVTIIPWRALQSVKDETLTSTIFLCVKSGELSMEEMCNEFEKQVCGSVYVLKFIF